MILIGCTNIDIDYFKIYMLYKFNKQQKLSGKHKILTKLNKIKIFKKILIYDYTDVHNQNNKR